MHSLIAGIANSFTDLRSVSTDIHIDKNALSITVQ